MNQDRWRLCRSLLYHPSHFSIGLISLETQSWEEKRKKTAGYRAQVRAQYLGPHLSEMVAVRDIRLSTLLPLCSSIFKLPGHMRCSKPASKLQRYHSSKSQGTCLKTKKLFVHTLQGSVGFLCWKMIYTNYLVSIIFETSHTGIVSFFRFCLSWDSDSELPFKTSNSHLRAHDGCCLK